MDSLPRVGERCPELSPVESLEIINAKEQTLKKCLVMIEDAGKKGLIFGAVLGFAFGVIVAALLALLGAILKFI
ncbi:MAG: hypothetical protein U0930_03805 [Pirellulales bacterium]